MVIAIATVAAATATVGGGLYLLVRTALRELVNEHGD